MSTFASASATVPTKPAEASWESMEYEGLPAWISIKNTFIDVPADRSLSLDEFVELHEQKCKSCPASGVAMHPASKLPRSDAIAEESDVSTTDGTRTPNTQEDTDDEVEAEGSWETMTYGELPAWTAVKHTFIDCPADRAWSLEQFMQFEQKCKSCPSSGVMMHPSSKPPQSYTIFEEEERYSVPHQDSATVRTGRSQTDAHVHGCHEQANEDIIVLNLAPMLQAQQVGPIFSVGSQAHHYGQCRPCGFAHKPDGCSKGTSCPFCHLCPPGTIKAKKQMKKEIMKMRKIEAFAQQQQMYMGL